MLIHSCRIHRGLQRLNCQAKHAFRDRVHAKYPNLKGEDLDKKVQEQGKKKQHCISGSETQKAILELFMLYLEWHPLLYFNPIHETVGYVFDVGEDAWLNQIMEMYKLCEELGEPWAWEYLWKNWYRPSD